MHSNSSLTRQRAAGFSLVEIMVGMVIGMFGLLIMMQVFSLAEEQKRTTTSGGDTQSTGAIALYGLQRDIRQAGWGTSDAKIIGCNVQLRTGVTVNSLAPVTINHASIPAGDANTDTLLVSYGNTNGPTQGNAISSFSATYPNEIGPQTKTLFANGERVIVTPATRVSPCNLILDTVTSTTAPTSAGRPQNIQLGTNYTASINGGTIFDIGPSPKVVAYAIRNGDLTQCDYMVNDCSLAANVTNTTIWVQIGGNIVTLLAQYGRDNTAPMDGYVEVFDQTAPTTACAFSRISAVRVAVVARSAQLERTAVTTVAPVWEGTTVQSSVVPTNPTALPIVLSGNSSWQNYRYKRFQTVVPIRNIVWAGVQAGC